MTFYYYVDWKGYGWTEPILGISCCFSYKNSSIYHKKVLSTWENCLPWDFDDTSIQNINILGDFFLFII